MGYIYKQCSFLSLPSCSLAHASPPTPPMRDSLLLGATVAVDPACWWQTVYFEDVDDDDGHGGPVKKSAARAEA